jgi:3',5'-cyclic AMP phosphodiesterase CpdA
VDPEPSPPALPALDDELPARHSWEVPPRDGWGSTPLGLAVEVGAFLASVAAGLLTLKVVHAARHLSQTNGLHLAFGVALFVFAFLLISAIGLYLWQRLSGLATLFAMLTDWGRAARYRGRPPVWLDAPPQDGLRVAHLTDLHIAEGARVRMVERLRPAGNQQLPRLLDRDELLEADVLIFTGDITDRGTSVSWRCFLDALEERGLAERAILVPGNHDIALVEHVRRTEALRSDRFGVVQLANLLKFGESFATTFGGTHGFVWNGKERVPYLEAWTVAERAVRPLVADLPSLPVPPLELFHYRRQIADYRAYVDRIEAARLRLLDLFPVAVTIPERDAVLFVLNSSARVFRHPAMNAFGHVGRAQYRRLSRLAETAEESLKLVAVHHHVVRRAEERGTRLTDRFFAKFTVLGDARPLVRFCLQHGVRAVLNGHRHLSYQLRLPNGTVLLAAPSSTLGDELACDPRPQFDRYDVAKEAVAPSVGIYRRAVRLPQVQAIAAVE